MFNFKVGTVRIFGQTSVLETLYSELEAQNTNEELIFHPNYVQFVVNKNEIVEAKDVFKQFVQQEGFYAFDLFLGVKYNQCYNESGWNEELWGAEDETVWNNIEQSFEPYTFDREYNKYLNSAEYKQEVQQRKINKIEKILAKAKMA